jgi:predicted CoA-binding protein
MTEKLKTVAAEFLSKQRVAVTGVSRTPKDHGGNVVYRRLRGRGYQVFAVNPNAHEVEGDPCYHDLQAIPGSVEWVLIATAPARADETMRQCVDLGIRHVWMHRGPGAGSVSETAAEYGRNHGVKVIAGGCPCMFDPTADPGHKAMRVLYTLSGKIPRRS